MFACLIGGSHDCQLLHYKGVSPEAVKGIEFDDGEVYEVVEVVGDRVVLQFTHSLKEKFARRNADREPVSYQGEGVGADSPRNN